MLTPTEECLSSWLILNHATDSLSRDRVALTRRTGTYAMLKTRRKSCCVTSADRQSVRRRNPDDDRRRRTGIGRPASFTGLTRLGDFAERAVWRGYTGKARK